MQSAELQGLTCWTLTKDAALQVVEVSVCGPRYWQHSVSSVAEAGNPLAACYSLGTLHVQRRAGVLSYADDPSGIRSLLSKAFRRVSVGFRVVPHRLQQSATPGSASGQAPRLPLLSHTGPGVQVQAISCTDDSTGWCSLLVGASCCCESSTERCLTDCSMPLARAVQVWPPPQRRGHLLHGAEREGLPARPPWV